MKKFYNIALSLWSVIILVAVLMPKSDLLKTQDFIIDIPHFDKIVHTVLFGTFAFLLIKVLHYKTASCSRIMAFAAAISLLYGFLTECLQAAFFRYIQRDFSMFDFLADAIGIIIALGIYMLVSRCRNQATSR
ncbi:MAG: VanZ family protein [Bacteroidales bacterium]|jgi:hypothetical protein|nr:VanZ family protein [Bacteroidales bacterium]